MVVDFGDVDEALADFIVNELDHRMLLRGDDPLVDALNSVGETAFLMQENPTAENISKLIFERALSLGLPVVSVRLWETPEAYAEFRSEETR